MGSHVSDYSDGIQYVEKLLRENDLKGAIDFSKRVKTSSRNLKKLSRFLANIVVHTFNKDEETDWYSVLGVDPSVDLKIMKIHYVQMVKEIRQIRSYEAHKILDKAWMILSNKFTRKCYDLRRRSREESQQNPVAVPLHKSLATENVSHALENINNAVISDQVNDFTDQREINEMDSTWNPWVNNAPHDHTSIACPSCHNESIRVCHKADCLQCGKPFAAMEISSPDAKQKEGKSLGQHTGDNIKNVPANHMPTGNDGQRGVYFCQAGNSQAEKVSSLLTDADKNILMTKARNVILNQLHKGNAAAIDHIEGNAAATEGPEEDGLKSMQVLDDFHDFDQKRTQESLADKKLNAYYVEIGDDFAHLLEIPGISY